MWTEIGLILGAYLYGSFPFIWITARVKGINLREQGSRNVGAANLSQAAGSTLGAIGGIVDFSKGVLPVVIGYFLLDVRLEFLCLAGIAAACGQIWPIFLKFYGGRGNTAGGGALAGFVITPLVPWATLICLVPLFLGVAIRKLHSSVTPTRVVPLGTLLTFILAAIFTRIFGEVPGAVTLTFIGVLVLILIRRLTADLRCDLKEKPNTVSTSSILINRLLYDRSYIDSSC